MKQVFEPQEVAPGVVEVRTEIEVVCAHCQDPVSALEEATGVCTNCGQPWSPKQSVALHATSQPMTGASA